MSDVYQPGQLTPEQRQANEQTRQQTEQAQKERNERVRAAYDEQRQYIDKENEEKTKRMEQSKPTPTQRENDLARLGLLSLDEEKEDHGAPDEIEHAETTRAMQPAPPDPSTGYTTRRGPGRPRKTG